MSQAAASTIRLFLLDDHAMFREGLAEVLEKQPGFQIAGQSASAAEALNQLPRSDATVVLLDVDLGSERAVDFVVEAKKKGFEGQILVVTAGVSGQEAVQLVQAGVAGIVHKQHSTEALCGAIRRVAAGEVCLEQNYLAALFRSVDRTRETSRLRLTDRERMLLRFILQGLTNKDIGARLQLSEGAVKFSLRKLCEKVAVRTRTQLVKVALEQFRDQL